LQGDGLNYLDELFEWDLVIAFPPCTYLTNTGNKWLKDQPPRKSGALVGAARRAAREEALAFVCRILNFNCKRIAIENPIGCISTRIKLIDGVYKVVPEGEGKLPPTQIIQPYHYGHEAEKATCLWLQGLSPLVPTKIVDKGERAIYASGRSHPKWYGYADKSEGQAGRAKIRSKTFEGIAEAMAEQWG
jgi:hypothetical protein